MAATLANSGTNPLTGKRALKEPYVKNVLSVMHSCGMYDYAGEWSYRIGLPAKSGVGGGIIAVLPGQFGIGTFSAPLDEQGNSCRGIQVCEELSERFKLHMFKTRFSTAAVVRRSYRATTVRSKRRRGSAQESILAQKSSTIFVYELQGNLFFSTIEQLLRQITAEIDSFVFLIVDLKRVLQIDDCAVALLDQMRDVLEERDKTLMLAHVPESCAEFFAPNAPSKWRIERLFSNIDSALEWCEDRLLEQVQPDLLCEGCRVPLSQMEILAGFSHPEIALIESVLKEMRYSAGQIIITEGDVADSLYFLAAGRVSISLNIKNGSRRQRLSTLTPGLAFGELALLDGDTRSADVIADEPTFCYVLPTVKLRALATSHPEIQSKLIFNIGRELSARLRHADAEIRSLAE
jgi:glutaminase